MYNIGVDLGNKGAIAITSNNKVIDVLKYPTEIYDKQKVKDIDKEIKSLSGLPRTKTKIKALKAEKRQIKRRCKRNFKQIYDFLMPHKDKISNVIIEEPIEMVAGGMITSATIGAINQTYGVYQAVLSILEMDYVLFSPKEWHKKFDYEMRLSKEQIKNSKDSSKTKLTRDEKRDIIKKESIRLAKEKFENIEDFWIPPRARNIDDNIVEACLLSLCGD